MLLNFDAKKTPVIKKIQTKQTETSMQFFVHRTQNIELTVGILRNDFILPHLCSPL